MAAAHSTRLRGAAHWASARPLLAASYLLLLLLLLLVLLLAALWHRGGAAALAEATAAPAVSPTPAQIERGSYLARIGNCAGCHTAAGGAAYAGGRAIDTPFGIIRSSNLTPDPQSGLGRWDARDFWRALHHGISRDGRALYPAFPYTSYSHVSRTDTDAIFAYLQTLPAVAQTQAPHQLRWPANTEWALRVWRGLYFEAAEDTAEAPDANAASLARGAYLVEGLGHCMECHGARNALGARTSATDAGFVLPGSGWYAPSLRDPQQASVAGWSTDDVVAFLQTGINARAQASGPMAEVVLHGTQYLSPSDARSMALYLMESSPPALASGPTGVAPASQSPQGEMVYRDHCAECHGANGEGRPGAYPALAGNRAVLMDNTNNLVLTVLKGGFAASTAGNPRPYGMPPFVLRLREDDIAAVLTHIRSAWGNQAPAVSEFDINRLRRSQVP